MANITSRTDQPEVGIEGLITLIQGGREAAVVVIELDTHAGVLGALAGEDEHGFTHQVGPVVVAGQPGMGVVERVVPAGPPGAVRGDAGGQRMR